MMVGQSLFDLFVEETVARRGTRAAAPELSVNPDLLHAIRGAAGRGAWDSHWSGDGRADREVGGTEGRTAALTSGAAPSR